MNRRLMMLAAAATALTLAACDSAGAGDGEADGGQEGETLIIYSNSVSDGRGEWLQEQASAEGFEIEFVDLGGGDIQNRLLAEANNPLADVVFGLNNVYFEKLKAAEVLAPYTPAWADEVDAEAGDGPDGQFWPIVREPIMLVYRDEAYPEGAGAPTDWPDLWEESQFHGLYETPTSLGGATTQMVISGILARHRDDAGELGVSDEGWEAIDAYFTNGSPGVQGTDLYARMASGEVNMGQMWLAGKASREEEYGIETTAVQPEIGVPMVHQHVAVVAGTDTETEAQRFVDWFGSAEVQSAWSNEFFTAPVNQAALATANQDAVAETDAFDAQDIDWSWVAENIDGWVEEIELNYVAN